MSKLAKQIAQMSPLKVALAAQQTADKLALLNADPIAIIGMSGRFPGADSLDDYWQLLANGVDAIRETPPDRWDTDAYYSPAPDAPGKMYSRHGGFLSQIDGFDPYFFGLSAREASSLDPQQRLLLEVSWEALEHANLTPDTLFNSATGVFVGICAHDYYDQIFREPEQIDAYFGTGNAHSVAAGRLSYILGLTGPNMAIDTACSSSLVALHLACQSLRYRESALALAGGVNLLIGPEMSINFSRARMLAPDGRCKSFDTAADGYGRGEGGGMVVLKRLADALAAGDRVYALIRGTAINQDGASGGLTVPSGPSQEAVIRQALENGGVEPEQVSYIEAHGTGTALGDPIEMGALGAVFGTGRRQPLLVGSVKSNFGHLESAAGIAGLLKVVLSLQNQVIPPNVHFNTPNPAIPWAKLPIKVPTQPMPWPDGRRIAGLSSFGFSGTNAHILLEEAPPPAPLSPTQENIERPLHLLTLSAKNEPALHALARRYEQHLAIHTLADSSFTANTRRTHFHERLALVAPSAAAAREQLRDYLAGAAPRDVWRGRAGKPKVALLFTGQGAQYVGMGRELYETQPTFRQLIQYCDEQLHTGDDFTPSLVSLLYAAPGDSASALLDQTAYTQPALFALEYALAKLWQAWGIQPAVMMGHSVGEYVAATLAGVFSLEDGLKLIRARGQLMQRLPQQGEMVAVAASEAACLQAIKPYPHVALAAINGPANVVLAGERQAVQEVTRELSAQGIRCKTLTVSHAFHSPLMRPMVADFLNVARDITYAKPTLKIVSNVTGAIAGPEIASPDYWVRHILQPVRFADGMSTLHHMGIDVFLEIGPKPTLLGMGRQCLPDAGAAGAWLPSLREGSSDWQQMASSLAELYVRGAPVDWAGFEQDYAAARQSVVLPSYPWQRQRYWLPGTAPAKQPTASTLFGVQVGHPLLQERLSLAGSNKIHFAAQLSAATPAYLGDHRFLGQVIVPATAYVEIALAAGTTLRQGAVAITELVIPQPLGIKEGAAQNVQCVLAPNDPDYTFEIFSLREEHWTLHATGKLMAVDHATNSSSAGEEDELARLHAAFARPAVQVYDRRQHYEKLKGEGGFDYGPSFQVLESVAYGPDEFLAEIHVAEGMAQDHHQLHPALLDGCFQAAGPLLAEADSQKALPAGVQRLECYRQPDARLWCYGKVYTTAGKRLADLRLFTPDGERIAEITGLQFKAAPLEERAWQHWLYDLQWHPQPPATSQSASTPVRGKRWLILADRNGVGTQLAAQLQTHGEAVTLLDAGADLQSVLTDVAYDRVLHLWSLDAPTADLATTSEQLCGSVLQLVQALANQMATPPRLWLITQGAQAVNGAPTAPGVFQSPLWGMGKVIALEHPELHCTLVDLAPEGTGTDALLAEVMSAPPDENAEGQIAFRAGVRHVARLATYSPLPPSTPQLRGDSTYLITGGVGALALQVAHFMVEQGARRLVLVGRSAPRPAAQAQIAALAKMGATITVQQADVTDKAQLAHVFAALDKTHPLRGIVHCAGLLADGILSRQNWESFAEVLAPKVQGAWHLHELSQAHELDFFVLFSSLASLIGSPGQANYAAANAFLDALAAYRQGLGLPALAINWGPWSAVGLARRAPVNANGLGRIAPQAGVTVFGQLLTAPVAQVGVLPIDWSQFAAHGPLFALVRPTADAIQASVHTFRQSLDAARPDKRRGLLETHVRAQVTQVLRGDPAAYDWQSGFFALGMDSLTAVELRNKLQSTLGLTLPATLLFDYPTLESLVDYLARNLLVEPAATNSPAVEEHLDDELGAFLADIALLPDDEIDQAFLQDKPVTR
ncbi:MAG: type I polyketide synthase [Caldilineaceae bacterium]